MYATYARMMLSPFLVGLLYNPTKNHQILATILFCLGAITDYLDGYWARKFQATSDMGKFMDPIADKIITLSALVMLLYLQRIDPFLVILLLVRDIFIGGVRSIAAKDQTVIAAKNFGKWKTALQMVAIPTLMLKDTLPDMALQWGYYLLWSSVLLSLISAIQYTSGYFAQKK